MADKDDPIAKLEGRVRALEALILELPETTPDRVKAAKAGIRARIKARDRQMAEALEALKAPLDEHAESALDAFLYRVENEKS
jgi:hypothetical protein